MIFLKIVRKNYVLNIIDYLIDFFLGHFGKKFIFAKI